MLALGPLSHTCLPWAAGPPLTHMLALGPLAHTCLSWAPSHTTCLPWAPSHTHACRGPPLTHRHALGPLSHTGMKAPHARYACMLTPTLAKWDLPCRYGDIRRLVDIHSARFFYGAKRGPSAGSDGSALFNAPLPPHSDIKGYEDWHGGPCLRFRPRAHT